MLSVLYFKLFQKKWVSMTNHETSVQSRLDYKYMSVDDVILFLFL